MKEYRKMLDFTICRGSTPTFFYFNLYLNTAYTTCTLHIQIWTNVIKAIKQTDFFYPLIR